MKNVEEETPSGFAKVDIPGEDFGELGKERKRIDTLASGEDLAKYTQAEEIAVKLETKLAEALRTRPTPFAASKRPSPTRKNRGGARQEKRKMGMGFQRVHQR